MAAQGRPEHPAAAEVAAEPARAHRLRAENVPGPTTSRCARSTCAPSCADPRGQTVERVGPAIRTHGPGRRPDASSTGPSMLGSAPSPGSSPPRRRNCARRTLRWFDSSSSAANPRAVAPHSPSSAGPTGPGVQHASADRDLRRNTRFTRRLQGFQRSCEPLGRGRGQSAVETRKSFVAPAQKRRTNPQPMTIPGVTSRPSARKRVKRCCGSSPRAESLTAQTVILYACRFLYRTSDDSLEPFPEGGRPRRHPGNRPGSRCSSGRGGGRRNASRRDRHGGKSAQFEIGRDADGGAIHEPSRRCRCAPRSGGERLLAAAGVDARRSTIVSLRPRDPANPYRGARGAANRASRAVMRKSGSSSGADRPRGQQAGADGHGRVQAGSEHRAEVHNPDRTSLDCGMWRTAPTRRNFEVSWHTRVIERPRWRRSWIAPRASACRRGCSRTRPTRPACGRGSCTSAMRAFGRLNRVADWLTGQGLASRAGRRRAAPRAAVRAALGGSSRAWRGCQGDETSCASRRSATGRAAPGCGSGSAGTRPIPRAAPRRRPGCSATVLVCDRTRSQETGRRGAGDNGIFKCAAGNEALAEWEQRWTGASRCARGSIDVLLARGLWSSMRRNPPHRPEVAP